MLKEYEMRARHDRTMALIGVLLLLVGLWGCGSGSGGNDDQQRQQTASNADTDDSSAPLANESGNDSAAGPRGEVGPLGDRLRVDQIRTRHLINGTVTAGKLAYSAVTVNVNATATTGSSSAATDLEGGVLVGCHPSGNQDQFMDNVVLNANGSITVTLAAAATAQNNFRCIVWKANAKGTS